MRGGGEGQKGGRGTGGGWLAGALSAAAERFHCWKAPRKRRMEGGEGVEGRGICEGGWKVERRREGGLGECKLGLRVCGHTRLCGACIPRGLQYCNHTARGACFIIQAHPPTNCGWVLGPSKNNVLDQGLKIRPDVG